jgi:hypothetical protein
MARIYIEKMKRGPDRELRKDQTFERDGSR